MFAFWSIWCRRNNLSIWTCDMTIILLWLYCQKDHMHLFWLTSYTFAIWFENYIKWFNQCYCSVIPFYLFVSWMITLICVKLCKYNHNVNWMFVVFSMVSHRHHHFDSFALCSFYFTSSRKPHLCTICLHYVLWLSSFPSSTPSICVSPLAPAPIFIQIHRAVSEWRPSDLNKACSSTSPSHSAPNPLASHCRPSKTGEHPEEYRTDV